MNRDHKLVPGIVLILLILMAAIVSGCNLSRSSFKMEAEVSPENVPALESVVPDTAVSAPVSSNVSVSESRVSADGPNISGPSSGSAPNSVAPAADLSAAAQRTVPSLPKPAADAVPVLYYHSVMIEEGNPLRMPPEQFDEQMKYLKKHGYQTITMDQLFQYLSGSGELPAKPILITFDDGYEDNYSTAWPILQKYGFEAAVFIVTNYIGGKGFMNWQQILELKRNGWDICGHTANHSYLNQTTASELTQELSSNIVLEQKLGQPVKYFAYPYGIYNAQIVQALKQQGYLMAFTTERGWAKKGSDPMLIRRVYCYADMGLSEFVRRIQHPNY